MWGDKDVTIETRDDFRPSTRVSVSVVRGWVVGWEACRDVGFVVKGQTLISEIDNGESCFGGRERSGEDGLNIRGHIRVYARSSSTARDDGDFLERGHCWKSVGVEKRNERGEGEEMCQMRKEMNRFKDEK